MYASKVFWIMGKQIFSDFLVKTNKTGNYFKVAAAELKLQKRLEKRCWRGRCCTFSFSVFNCRTMSFDTYRINLIFYLLFSPFSQVGCCCFVVPAETANTAVVEQNWIENVKCVQCVCVRVNRQIKRGPSFSFMWRIFTFYFCNIIITIATSSRGLKL